MINGIFFIENFFLLSLLTELLLGEAWKDYFILCNTYPCFIVMTAARKFFLHWNIFADFCTVPIDNYEVIYFCRLKNIVK